MPTVLRGFPYAPPEREGGVRRTLPDMSSAPWVDVRSCPTSAARRRHTGWVRLGAMQVEAVSTTGIYCRAECSATPLARNALDSPAQSPPRPPATGPACGAGPSAEPDR